MLRHHAPDSLETFLRIVSTLATGGLVGSSQDQMHTSRELSSAAFSVRIGGRPAKLGDVFDHFTEQDRLGVVVRRPCGAAGASTLILATVTAFYDLQRAKQDDFFIYPDYFVFHVRQRWGNHGRLDIWPPHKEVVVQDNPDALLCAINDRAVTRLLVEEARRGEPELGRESVASARARIATVLAYSAAGRVADPDVCIAGNTVTESYVRGVIERSQSVMVEDRAALAGARRGLYCNGAPVETYRRLTLDDALSRL